MQMLKMQIFQPYCIRYRIYFLLWLPSDPLGRPSFLPLVLTLASPALTRSERRWLSIQATQPAIAKKTSAKSPGASVQLS